MKITDLNIDQLLYTKPVKTQSYEDDEEGGGFFKKLFSKKAEPEIPFFNQRVEEFGRDELYDDIKEGYDAYIVKGAPFETMVVLSRSYLILPEKEIFPLYDVTRFAIKTEHYGNRPYEQYALDILYEYVFPMEVADRKDFREKLNERLAPVGVFDASDEEVMEGSFPDDGEC